MTTSMHASFVDVRADRERREREHPEVELPSENID
jgi:hypothetical protein